MTFWSFFFSRAGTFPSWSCLRFCVYVRRSAPWPLRGLWPRSGKKLVEKNSSLLFQKIFQLLKIKLFFFINFIKKMKKSSGKLDVEILSKNSGFPKKWKNKEFSLFSPGLGRRCAFGKRCVFTWMCSFCCLKKILSKNTDKRLSLAFSCLSFSVFCFLLLIISCKSKSRKKIKVV